MKRKKWKNGPIIGLLSAPFSEIICEYSMYFLTCETKIDVKEIPANKNWKLGRFYFESQAIDKRLKE